MPDFFVTTFSTTARTLANGETGFLDRDGTLFVSAAAAITSTDGITWLRNSGFIFSYEGTFSAIDANGSSFDLFNGVDGVIDAENPFTGTVDIDVIGSASIVNHGTIASSDTRAIDFTSVDLGASFRLMNTGKITADLGNAIEVDVGDSLMWIVNTGDIIGGQTALDLDADTRAIVHHLDNSGSIIGLAGSAISFNFSDSAVFRVSNSGRISAAGTALATGSDNALVLNNTGTIETRFPTGNAINTENGFDVLRNSGTIIGDLDLGSGNDSVHNSGTIFGDIDLNSDSDLFDNNGGLVTGTVLGDIGNDTLLGGAEADHMDGGADADTLVGRDGDDALRGAGGSDFILGGAGNDSIAGGTENDTMNGQDGDDTLEGGAGNDAMTGGAGPDVMDGGADNDTMNGQDGEDVLEGGTGNDILRGGNGDDALAGGEGFDLLTGGAGFDSFVFRALSETAPGALRDQILDFEQGIDLIVVAGLSPGVFEFRGTAAFAPSGNPELRLFETTTGSTIVQIDADGNGTIDAEIRVANVTGLTAEDFVL